MPERGMTMVGGMAVPTAVANHMKQIGFAQLWSYNGWCRQNNISTDHELKTKKDFAAEAVIRKQVAERDALIARLDRKPKQFIDALCLGEIDAEVIKRPGLAEAASAIAASNPETRDSLAEMLHQFVPYGRFLFETTGPEGLSITHGLVKLHDRKALWVRPLDEFSPRSKSRHRIFGELAHHLFDAYGDVPSFMDSAWLRTGPTRYRNWFVHLGQGRNFRTAKTPMPFTKKMAHEFMHAPETCTIEQAVRYAQMSTMGATPKQFEAICASILGRGFEHEEFWETFLRWLAANPLLDPQQISPLVDYVHNQRFAPVEILRNDGTVENGPPPQPNLTMRGRRADQLLSQMEDWHHELGRNSGQASRGPYRRASAHGYVATSKGNPPQTRRIRQILSNDDLIEEGRILNHCIASYHSSIVEGYYTVWSMSEEHSGVAKRVLTIAVQSDAKQIVEARGKANALPSQPQRNALERWASAQKLTISDYA